MTNTTDVFWSANGVSLQTEAWNIRTRGPRYRRPGKRGEDLLLPFRRGRRSVRKVRESLVLEFPMWLVPRNPDGSKDETVSDDEKAKENWDTIMAAVDVDGQFPLVKRWTEAGVVKSATAYAEMVNTPEPTSAGGPRLEFSLQMLLADPYFYVPKGSVAVAALTVGGDAPTDHVQVTLTGGTNPRVTASDGNWVQYNGTPDAPVTIDMATGMAKKGSQYVNGLITRNQQFAEWLTLEPGATLTLTGGGTATVVHDEAWK